MRPIERRAPRVILSAVLVTALLPAALAVGAQPATAAPAVASHVRVASGLTVGLPTDWVARGSGMFTTADRNDVLVYEVRRNQPDVPADEVRFRLTATDTRLWWKTLAMPDGEGNRWDLHVNPSAGRFHANNGLWAHQVRNGQSLELWKAGVLNTGRKVLEIGDLESLPGGSRVVFTWIRD
ncbi:hypothetical protein ACFUMH_15940 [Cellulomonas sp. NPDC057328]|uniref:hypothetical protein n=1 Tax=Cellulomonas sp. NPDC057328 TaxID=3346101 RepID=UPI0036332C1D